ncbi:hypothetical protein EV424DRAFT_1644612 [Suillus variegatus]|nr:hypothetical protein EV424DRAFT_1644612 [Suillus variegatus]
MQLTLLASLAVLCTSAFAAPIDGRSPAEASVIAYVEDVLENANVNALTKRDDGLVDVIAYVENVLNDATVNVLTRDVPLVDVIAAVTNDLNDLTVNVLTKRETLADVIVDVQDDLDNLNVNVLTKRETLADVIVDVQDDLDNLNVNVLTKRDTGLVDVIACEYHLHDFFGVVFNPIPQMLRMFSTMLTSTYSHAELILCPYYFQLWPTFASSIW